MSNEPRDSKVKNLRDANMSATFNTNTRARQELLDDAASSYTDRADRAIGPDSMAILRFTWSPLMATAGVDMDQSIDLGGDPAFELVRDKGLRERVDEIATEETAAAMFTGWHAPDIIADIIEDLVAKPDDALYKVGDQWH